MLSSGHREQVERLRASAASLPWGYARAELLQEAAQVADTHHDLDLGFETRLELIDAAQQAQRYELFAVTFAWCFANTQSHPGRFPLTRVLRSYQYVIGNLANFAHVSRRQYDELDADACRHFVASGYSLRGLTIQRRAVAADFGDPGMAAAADRAVGRYGRDELSLDPEKEALRQVEFELFRGDEVAAARGLDAHFSNDRRDRFYDLNAANVAVRVYARQGRAADAARLHESVYRRFPVGGGYGWSWANHLSYCAAAGRLARGAAMLRRQLPVAMGHADGLTRYQCLSHALPLLDALAASGQRTIRLPAVPGLPDRPEIDGVRAWLDAEVAAIAADFDRRNGNGYYTDLTARRRAGQV